MTNRDFFSAIATNDALTAEIREFAENAIAKLDERNAKRSSTPSKTAIANEPIKAAILEYLENHDGFVIASEIADALEITTSKVSALCRQLIEAGSVKSEDVKVPKRGKVKGYTLIK